MEVFRICRAEYAQSLYSSGSANRWNMRGQQVIYAGGSRSLSTLELVVHRSTIAPPVPYRVMVISIADDDRLVYTLRTSDLPANWRTLEAYSELQKIGGHWYSGQQSLVLRVPSAVIPFEFNYVINAEHPDFDSNVQLVRTEAYFWDDRLL